MTPPITDEQLAELEALERAATPGEWRAGYVDHDCVFVVNDAPDAMGPERVLLRMNKHFPRNHEDTTLIAAARTALPSLLAELRETREALALVAEAHDAALALTPASEGTARQAAKSLLWHAVSQAAVLAKRGAR